MKNGFCDIIQSQYRFPIKNEFNTFVRKNTIDKRVHSEEDMSYMKRDIRQSNRT